MRPVARCVHHKPKPGAVPTFCDAGVRYRDVYERGVGPCITLSLLRDRRSACALYEPVRDDVLDAEERDVEEALKRFEAGSCPQCGATLERRENAAVIIWVCPAHGSIARGCKRASV